MKRWHGIEPSADVASLVPELKPQARARAERIAFDTSGRMALEAQVRVLPWGQAEKTAAMALSAAPLIQAGKASRIRRKDLEAADFPKHDRDGELSAAATEVREIAAQSGWFRRAVAAAVGKWSLARKLSPKEQRATRGGQYVVEGFCQDALGWLVPRVDEGATWSRSSVWGASGPFMLLGERARRPGRAPSEQAGLGLWVRWQPPIDKARFKGPIKTRVTASGDTVTEQWALAQSRYDKAMSGRTAWSAAMDHHNPAAREFCKALCPWLFDEDDGHEAEPVELREQPPAPAELEDDAAADPTVTEPCSSAPERPPERGPPAEPLSDR